MNCESHHQACDCREQNFSALINSTLDCLCELDAIKNVANINKNEKSRICELIERTYVAIEVVQFSGGIISPEFAARMIGCADEQEVPA